MHCRPQVRPHCESGKRNRDSPSAEPMREPRGENNVRVTAAEKTVAEQARCHLPRGCAGVPLSFQGYAQPGPGDGLSPQVGPPGTIFGASLRVFVDSHQPRDVFSVGRGRGRPAGTGSMENSGIHPSQACRLPPSIQLQTAAGIGDHSQSRPTPPAFGGHLLEGAAHMGCVQPFLNISVAFSFFL